MSVHFFESRLDGIIFEKDQWTVTFLEITKENLNTAENEQNCPNEYLQEICCVKFNNYDEIEKFVPKEVAQRYKKTVEESLKKLEEEFYEEDEWDSEYFIHIGLIFCEKNIIYSYELPYKNYIEPESGSQTEKQLF